MDTQPATFFQGYMMKVWNTETTVIRQVRRAGKWVEVWVEGAEGERYTFSTKAYRLFDAIEVAGLEDRVVNRGCVGLGVVRGQPPECVPGAFEIIRVFEATPDTD